MVSLGHNELIVKHGVIGISSLLTIKLFDLNAIYHK